MNILEWLEASDPTLAWQVQRDLLHCAPAVWQETRERTRTEGNGAILIAQQGEDGMWEHGAFFPWYVREGRPGHPWKATTTVLHDLRVWGVDPGAIRADTVRLLRENARWEYDDLPYWDGEVDACINGMTLATGAWLNADVSKILRWFPDHQLADGGWNCEWVNGSTVSSFVSTLNSLVSLLAYEELRGSDPAIRAMRKRGETYLLERELMYRRSTGELHPWVLRFSYPPRHTYNILRALDYFRAAARFDGTLPDKRLTAAIAALEQKQAADGTWHADFEHPGDTWTANDRAGQPSKWLTFYALRILAWWAETTRLSAEAKLKGGRPGTGPEISDNLPG